MQQIGLSSTKGPVLLPEVLTIQRRPSPKLMFMFPDKSLQFLQCLTAKVKFPSLLQAKMRFLLLTQIVFDGNGCFPGPPYHIQVDPSVTPKQAPCLPFPVCLKESFKQEINKVLQTGVLKPVNQATPWTNSFVLVEGKDKQGNLKLRICLHPTNLNKAIMCGAIPFQDP